MEEKIGKAVADGEVDLGVAICGTGLGISMAANKVHGVRAAVCSEPYTAKYNSSMAEGMGYAIPSNQIKPTVESLLETGTQPQPYIGITGTNASP